mmetsp:Transcript_88364/g.161857  ORF Transcript_88364/g.161857 Transcript_88364/m.161857 type:complete len:562 (-) Transcript_88364:92-1777(-)
MPTESVGLSLGKCPVRDLKAALRLLGASLTGCVERGDFIAVLLAASASQLRAALGKPSPSQEKDDAETKAKLLNELIDASAKAGKAQIATDDSSILQPRTVVRLFNLQSAPALNMQKAVVLGRDPATERYEVRLDYDGSIKKVRYENLQVEESQPAREEQPVEDQVETMSPVLKSQPAREEQPAEDQVAKEEEARQEAEQTCKEAEQRQHEEDEAEEQRRCQVEEEGGPMGVQARTEQAAGDPETESHGEAEGNAQDVQSMSGAEGAPEHVEAGAEADKEDQGVFEECFAASAASSPARADAAASAASSPARADERDRQAEAPHVLVLPASPAKSPAAEVPVPFQSLKCNTPPKNATKLRLGYGPRQLDRTPGRMSEGLRDLWRSGDLCDLTVACRESTFRVHSLVLAGHSKKLRQFVKGQSEVTFPGVQYPETVQLLLEFLYEAEAEKGYAPSSHEVNLELLQTAHEFDLPPLKRQAAVFMAQGLTTQNVVEALLQCAKFELEDLKERIFCHLAKNKAALADVTTRAEMSQEPEILRQILLRVATENGGPPRAKRARLVT